MDQDQNWQDLCQAAATERDPKKLMALIAELIKALDSRDRKAGLAGGSLNDCCTSQASVTFEHRSDTTCESGLSL